MIMSELISDGRNLVKIRALVATDCQQYYVDWLNDEAVTQFLEQRWQPHDLKSVKKYFEETQDWQNNFMFAICHGHNERHIGNIKVSYVSHAHGIGDVTYFIGDRNYWGRGCASEAIRQACVFAFDEKMFHAMQAGAYAQNEGSARALIKNGFEEVGRFPNKLLTPGSEQRDDHVLFWQTAADWRARNARGMI